MVEIGAFAALIVAWGLVSGRLQGTIITAPIVFATAGVIGGATGEINFGFEVLEEGEKDLFAETGEFFVTAAEIALALVLFTDATRIDLKTLRGNAQLPGRLLLVGFPLTIGFAGAVAIGLFPDLDIWEAFLVAAILVPTDAALGQVVVSSPIVPVRIRQALNVESGLNDGMAVPLWTIFLTLAVAEEAVRAIDVVQVIIEKLGYGLLVGIAVGLIGGWLVSEASKRGWMTGVFQQLTIAALAVLTWWGAEEVGGSGFVAAFVGGIAAGHAARDLGQKIVDFTEDIGQLLELFIFFAFGVIAVLILDVATWQMVVYALLALTVIRALPVAISLIGTDLRSYSVIFLGWFGPRGLASIILGLLVIIEEPLLPGANDILLIMTVTVMMSIYAHGISAAPLAERYGRRTEDMPEEAPEMVEVPELPTRREGSLAAPRRLMGSRPAGREPDSLS